MSESHIQLPKDGLGKKLRSIVVDLGSGDVHHELFIPTDQSGQIYTEANPFYVNVSGNTVQLQSGTMVQLPSTQVVNVSGQTVVVASGHVGSVAITDDGGTARALVTTVESDAVGGTNQALYVANYNMGYSQDGNRWSRLRVNKSGQGALVVASSGQDHIVIQSLSGEIRTDSAGNLKIGINGTNGIQAEVFGNAGDGLASTTNVLMVANENLIYDADADKFNRVRTNLSGQGALSVASSGQSHIVTGKHASSAILFSGYGTTNTIAVSGIGFAIHEQATVYIENLGGGSGINYSVRGHIVSGLLIDALISGTIHSGTIETQTLSDAYEYIDVGIDSTQDNFSGLVTVGLVRK